MKPFFFIAVVFATAFVSCNSNTPPDSAAGAPAPTGESTGTLLSDTEASFVATKKTDAAQLRGEATIKPYPFRTCAVQIHRPFKDGKAKHRRVYQGHEVLFCCDPCVKAFDMYPDAYMPRIKEAVAAKEARQH